ncbi:MAG: hypothetical protein U1C74_04385 [Phenylobacterium sp.]|nr:hypothetical protein [Phenylobacterium sp.]
MADFIYDTPLLAVAGGLFIALLAAREAGGWLAHQLGSDGGERTEQGFILSGVLGLLALLIAFTFGLALDRYETRREFVVAEANAIGTADMRARLLAAPEAERLTNLLRSYAEARLEYGRAEASGKPALQQAATEMRARLQAETLAAVEPLRGSPLVNLIVPAINETIDVGAAREAAMDAHLPTEVLAVLVIYAVVAAGVLGGALAGGRPHRLMTALMFLLLTLAVAVILDLDRPRRGLVTVSQAPMAMLVEALRTTPPPAPLASPPSPVQPAPGGAGGSSRP